MIIAFVKTDKTAYDIYYNGQYEGELFLDERGEWRVECGLKEINGKGWKAIEDAKAEIAEIYSLIDWNENNS
jgi:hypothetical protein